MVKYFLYFRCFLFQDKRQRYCKMGIIKTLASCFQLALHATDVFVW